MNHYRPCDLIDLLHLSKARVYQLIESGELRVIRIGRKILIAEDDLRAYLEGKKEGGKDHVRPEI